MDMKLAMEGSKATETAWDLLAPWGALTPRECLDNLKSASEVSLAPPPASPASPFAVDRALNTQISLWRGAIWTLRVDAVVNSTCERLCDDLGVSGKLLAAAGPQIALECAAAGVCHTGEAVLTRGCQLPAKFILHTVAPRYVDQYRNAAEHALHSCYRSVLTAAKENGLRSVALGCVYTRRKGYPREEAAHVAIRTVRRFLEHYSADFDRIVLCVDSAQDEAIYNRVLPLYFPRSIEEERSSQKVLASRDIGDSFGEPVIAERMIRIGVLGSKDNDVENGVNNQDESQHPDQENGTIATKETPHTSGSDSAIEAFRAMLEDPDVARLQRLQQRQEERQRRALQATNDQRQRDMATSSAWNYSTALHRAKQEDFSDLQACGFCYNAGVDLAGLPVLVYLAGKLVPDDVDLERVLLFVLFTLDAQKAALTPTNPQFSVLYVQSDVTGANYVSASWLQRLFRVFATASTQPAANDQPMLPGHENKPALRFFYVLEPTMTLKFQLLLSKGYGGSFYHQVVYLSRPEMLDSIAPTLQLPPHIYTRKEEITDPTPEATASSRGCADESRLERSSAKQDIM